MKEVTIETGVPFPKGRTVYSRYPWREMKIGDSLKFENHEELSRGATAASTFARRNFGFKFRSARYAMGGRIWRIECNGSP